MDELKRILDSDELILKSYYPRKKRAFILSLISLFPSLFVISIFVLIGVLGLTGVIKMTNENTGEIDNSGAVIMLIFAGVFVFFILLGFVKTVLSYRKLLYVVTNKRIIIQHGFIGTDFKSLNLDAISGVDVRVDFLDKVIKPNTGTIIFSSPSIAVSSQNGKINQSFTFKFVDNPYDVYREIKEIISQQTGK